LVKEILSRSSYERITVEERAKPNSNTVRIW